MVANFESLDLRAPWTDFDKSGFFGKPYVSTFDCATIYGHPTSHQKTARLKANNPPLEPEPQITTFMSLHCSVYFSYFGVYTFLEALPKIILFLPKRHVLARRI